MQDWSIRGDMCSTGTSTCVSKVAGGECSLHAVKHVIPGARLIVSPISYSGGCLAWGMSLLFPDVYSSEPLSASLPGPSMAQVSGIQVSLSTVSCRQAESCRSADGRAPFGTV